jgi:hypothetical protein
MSEGRQQIGGSQDQPLQQGAGPEYPLKVTSAMIFGEGITTADGAVDGTTLIDDTRTEPDDYWIGCTILITSGACAGQSRTVIDWDSATWTFTVAPVFTAQILTGVNYTIQAPPISVQDPFERLKTIWGWDEFPVTERWEWLGTVDQLDIMKIRWRGRTGSWWRSEGALPHTKWTMPIYQLNRYPALPPWTNAIHLRNSRDGVVEDEIYLGMKLKKGLRKGMMRLSIEVPDVAALPWDADPTHYTLIAAGFEANSQGNANAVWVGWMNDAAGARMAMSIVPMGQRGNYISTVSQVVVQQLPGVLALMYLEFNPPVFRLIQYTGAPGVLQIDELVAPECPAAFSMLPFVCNESKGYVVSNVYLGDNISVWDLNDDTIAWMSTPFVNPMTNPEITLDVGNRCWLEIFVDSIVAGAVINLYGSRDRVNWRLCKTYTTDAATLFHKGLMNAYRFVKLELIEVGAGTSILELTASGGV